MTRPIVLLFFFLSGLTGLLYEVVWIRTAGTVIGNTTYAIGTVVGVYMGGLALGAWLGGRVADRRTGSNLLAAYGILEIGIAVGALAVPLLLTASEPLFRVVWNSVGEMTLIYALLRALLVAIILIAPTTLMGATLPILTRYLSSSHQTAAREAGRAYAINTFGGVAGTLAAGFWLIPSFGLQTTTALAAAANVAIGSAAFLMARGKEGGLLPALEPPPAPHRLALAVAAFSGLTALVYEVVWTRALILAMGSTVYAFTLVLTAFILGLAAGSAACSRFLSRFKDPIALLGWIQAAIGIAAVALLPLLGRLPLYFAEVVAEFRGDFEDLLFRQFLVMLLFVFVPAFIMGTVFPVTCRLAARTDSAIGRSVGAVYTWNTLGSIAGSLLASFLLIPALGLDRTVKIVACLNFALSAFLFFRAASPRVRFGVALPAAVLIVTWLLPAWNPYVQASGAFLYGPRYVRGAQSSKQDLQAFLEDKNEIIWSRWDTYGLVTLHRHESGNLNLRINGKVDASTGEGDMVTQNLLAHLPLLHHPNPQRAMVIGLGGGFTAGTAAKYPLDAIDCVELSPAVAQAARFFREHNGNVLEDPRVRVIVGDGRNAVLFTPEKYDVIISEPSNLWLSGMASLFTRNFFDSVRDRLAPNGIFCQWIHAYRLSLEDFQAILRTYAESFPHLSLWEVSTGNDYLLIGSREPLARSYAGLDGRLSMIDAGSHVKDPQFPGAQTLLGSLVTDRVALEASLEGSVITDDHCTIEYSAPRSLHVDDRARILAWLDRFRGEPVESRLYHFPDIETQTAVSRRRAGRRKIALVVRAYVAKDGPDEAVRKLDALREEYGLDRQTQELLDSYCLTLLQMAFQANLEPDVVRAARHFQAVPESSEHYAAAQTGLGGVFRMMNDLKRAERHLLIAARLAPESAETSAELAMLLQVQGKIEAAAEGWKETVRLNPNFGRAWYELAKCLQQLGRKSEALEAARRALRLSPGSKTAQKLVMSLGP